METQSTIALERLWFYPSLELATEQRRAIETRLLASLEYLASVISIPTSLIQSIQNGVRPLAFGGYYKLVDALAKRDFSGVECTIGRLSLLTCPRNELSEPQKFYHLNLEQEWESHWYAELFDHDEAKPLGLANAYHADHIEGLINSAFIVIEQCIPALYSEIQMLVRQIVLANSVPPGSFAGASALSMYGAILINTSVEHCLLSMIELLVHEAAHNLVHGFTLLTPLHEHMNDKTLYTSPLRTDARPIEGIFHACFVIARMHYCLAQLELARPMKTIHWNVTKRLEILKSKFSSGISTLDKHAVLTAEGRWLMAQAKEYMESS